MTQIRRPIRGNALAFAHLVTALLDGGYSAKELTEITGLAIATVRRYLYALHKTGAAYISGWDQDDCGRYRAAQYSLGMGIDVKKPKPAPQKLKSARWRKKRRNIDLLQRMAA